MALVSRPRMGDKAGRQSRAAALGIKSLMAAVAPAATIHNCTEAWDTGKLYLSVRARGDPTLEHRVYLGGFLSPASEFLAFECWPKCPLD